MNAPIDISHTVLRTRRLTLRPWRMDDLNDFYAYARVDGVGQMAGWPPHKSIAESQAILNHFIENKNVFALEHQGHAIGSLGIERYNEAQFPAFAALRCREIGYVLAKEHWGKGLMPEAVGAALEYLFVDVGLDAVFCGHFLSNRQSARVQEKCGFHHLAFVTCKTQTGDVKDEEMNILTRAQWLCKAKGAKG